MSGILIIDDSASDRKMLGEILHNAGYVISGTAQDGETGISLYHELHPELVLIDMIMPGLNGIDTLRGIMSEHPDAKVMLCTSIGQNAIVDLAMRNGAQGYVVKPFDPDILITSVRRILGSPLPKR